ncbi:hypothetical protein ACQPZG_32140 [Streptomyces sp. CA-294286]|uniref:hypothetical protein n=1 Tax=Streptomyces sp. CA-294286 TaxID=3240070 RepID=UPI003D8E9D17
MREALSGGSGWVLVIGIVLLVVMAVLLTLPQSSLAAADPAAPEAGASGEGQEAVR